MSGGRIQPNNARVRKHWGELSRRQQGLIIAGVAVETALKAAMLADLRRRTADQVRGPRWAWACSALVNSAGLIPVGYFVYGRRRNG